MHLRSIGMAARAAALTRWRGSLEVIRSGQIVEERGVSKAFDLLLIRLFGSTIGRYCLAKFVKTRLVGFVARKRISMRWSDQRE